MINFKVVNVMTIIITLVIKPMMPKEAMTLKMMKPSELRTIGLPITITITLRW